MRKLLFLLISLGIGQQSYGQKFGLKRYQYDEFIYGLTVPTLHQVKQIAAYYQISENDIVKFNQRFNQEDLTYEKGKIIYLPAGVLLNNKNVAFQLLLEFYEKLPTHQFENLINHSFIEKSNTKKIISDILIAEYMLTDTSTNCEINCSNAVAKIEMGGDYIGFVMEKIIGHDSEIYLYIYFHNDFLRKIKIGGMISGDGGHEIFYSTFKDYNQDGLAEILVKRESESYNYENIYIGTTFYKEYEIIDLQIDHHTYELYQIVDGNYLNVSMDFLLKP